MRPSNLLALFFLFFLTGCTSLAPKFKVPVFLHDQIPVEICGPEIEDYGIYRILENGEREYLPYTSDEIRSYFGVHSSDVELVEETVEE